MDESILNSTKKILGVLAVDTAFDQDILTFINTALANLTQVGVGPEAGFSITDDTAVWSDFVGNEPRLNGVQTYVYLQCKILFDPPGTSFHLDAINEQLAQQLFRLSVQVDPPREVVV